ncbi:MAG TPA: glycosyltransferase family 39 protein [Thermoleophilaceae bacterium]|nr:glycosyltransferase family 39 protein [Thermoleophilaceae bacterium]
MRRLASFRARVGLIALAGVALRLGYVLGPARDTKGIGDWYFFHWGANLIADGHWFVEPFLHTFEGRLVPSAGHPPLWELLLSGVSFLGGTSYLAHRALGCILGGGTILLAALLGRRIGGERAGLTAAVLAAVYPVMVAADGSLMSEGLYTLLIAAALLAALRLRDRPDVRAAALLGAVVGLAAQTRSEALLLFPLLVLPVALTRPRGRFALAAASVLAAAVLIAPWTVRNWAEFGRPVLISTNDGTLLAGANCDLTYHGKDVGFWNIECISERSLRNEARQEARWRSEGADYLGDHLGRLPLVLAARLARTWDLYQPRRMVLYAEGRWVRAEQAGTVVYYLLLPLAIAGGFALRRRRSDLLVLLAPVALVVALSLIGYGIPRFRAPAEITLVVLAALTISRLLERRSASTAPQSE